MTTERDVLFSLLALTRTGPTQKEPLAKHVRLPAVTVDKLLKRLFKSGLLQENGGIIETSPSQRVKIAVQALRLGADFQRVCSKLSWTEFESITAQAFEANDYRVVRNFRFKKASRRWEIDIVGLKKPLILCVDCKHWKRSLGKAAATKVVNAQVERTRALAQSLSDLNRRTRLDSWKTAKLIPIVMSLIPGPSKFLNDVPVVPILQFQDFINELPLHADSLRHITQKIQS